MTQYASNPSIIEAVQWTGDNFKEMKEFAPDKVVLDYEGDDETPTKLMLHAGKDGSQEWVPVPVNHWLVHQPDDLTDIWPVDPDYFAAKYHGYDATAFTLADFRAFGLLWLVNKVVFHPRGFAMGIDDDAQAWVMYGDGTEPWYMYSTAEHAVAIEAGADPEKLPTYPVDEDDAFMRVAEFFASLAEPVEEGDSATKG